MKKLFAMLAFGLILLQSSNNSLKALDLSYVISMTTPANSDILYSNTSITIGGNVNWPFYKQDVDQVYITIFDPSTSNVIDYKVNAITSSGKSYCNFSMTSNLITASGTYGILIQAIKNGVTLNQKVFYIYVN